jgi:hypothetical protein
MTEHVSLGALGQLGTPADAYLRSGRFFTEVIVDGMIHDNPYYIEPGRFAGGPRPQ